MFTLCFSSVVASIGEATLNVLCVYRCEESRSPVCSQPSTTQQMTICCVCLIKWCLCSGSSVIFRWFVFLLIRGRSFTFHLSRVWGSDVFNLQVLFLLARCSFERCFPWYRAPLLSLSFRFHLLLSFSLECQVLSLATGGTLHFWEFSNSDIRVTLTCASQTRKSIDSWGVWISDKERRHMRLVSGSFSVVIGSFSVVSGSFSVVSGSSSVELFGY